MSAAVDKVIAEIRQGKCAPVYLLHGDEFLTREGAKRLVDALVPTDRQAFSVETISEDQEVATLPLRLRTVSLFGGTKVVVVHDSKAFVSRQKAGDLFERSWKAWKDEDAQKSTRIYLQAVGAAGEGEGFLERAARGDLDEEVWGRLGGLEREPESEAWLQEVSARALAEGLSVPKGSGPTRVYEDLLAGGLPTDSVLVMACEVVDERRALFKSIKTRGIVIDCSLGPKKDYATQMNPDAARAKIREAVAGAGKTIDREAGEYILERTGLSMRALSSELEKLLLFVGSQAKIGVADVSQVLSGSREAGVFDLTNALSERDAARAIRALRGLLIQREPAVRLVGLLASEVRNLLLARSLLEERLGGQFDGGMSYGTFQARVLPKLQAVEGATESIGEGTRPKNRMPGIHPFRLYSMLRCAAAFSQAGLLRALDEIAETDLALKTSGQPEALLLEGLLLRICAC